MGYTYPRERVAKHKQAWLKMFSLYRSDTEAGDKAAGDMLGREFWTLRDSAHVLILKTERAPCFGSNPTCEICLVELLAGTMAFHIPAPTAVAKGEKLWIMAARQNASSQFECRLSREAISPLPEDH
jgi:hypothetical protein